MALITGYSDTNKRELSGVASPAKPTGMTFIDDATDKSYAMMQSVTEDRYQYFGMTKAAAKTCATEIKALSTSATQYTATWSLYAGNMYQVDVVKSTVTITIVEIGV